MGAGASLFASYLTRDDLLVILQPLVVALSIMAAALLVRLNRGMPTLDWKSLEASERKILTSKIVKLTREYMVVLAVHAFTLVVLLIFPIPGTKHLSSSTQFVLLALVGGLVGLAISRMAYIVWRDYDVVRLQKKLIDESADREAVNKASEEALSKVTAIRASGLRPGPKPEVSAWKE
jgi:hypothetical protein